MKSTKSSSTSNYRPGKAVITEVNESFSDFTLQAREPVITEVNGDYINFKL
jgi:hypothetical protein